MEHHAKLVDDVTWMDRSRLRSKGMMCDSFAGTSASRGFLALVLAALGGSMPNSEKRCMLRGGYEKTDC